MSKTDNGIGLLRGFTNHPARFLWAAMILALSISWWSVHLAVGGGRSWAEFLGEL
jgi:hypothetical protein